MCLRTSIIGEEINNKLSLIEWTKSKANSSILGFDNHIWNGITTKECANSIIKIINCDLWQKGTYHIFSNKITKHDLLHLINDKFSLNLDIKKVNASQSIDRSLSSENCFCSSLKIPTIESMIEDIR
jgi:dTDP-4-dehydrorhamnose reductase